MTNQKAYNLLCLLGRMIPLCSLGYAGQIAPWQADPNTLCCAGLAQPSAGAINLPMRAKVELDVRQECQGGRAMRAISFHHNKGEDLTYQESFGLQCATSPSTVTDQCNWSSLVSNFQTQTMTNAPPGWVITGVRFTHKNDENFVYQQSYAVKSCRLQNPKPDFKIGEPGGTIKWHLDSNASCEKIYGGVRFGLVNGLGFNHHKDYNNTSQEQVTLACNPN